MFLSGIRIAGAAVIATAVMAAGLMVFVAMMAFATTSTAQAPEVGEYTLDIPEPEQEAAPEAPAVVAPAPIVPETVVPTETVEPEPVEKKKKPKPEPPFIDPYDGLGLSQPLAYQQGDAVSALSRTGFVIPMGIALLVMTGLLIRSRRRLRAAQGDSRNSTPSQGS